MTNERPEFAEVGSNGTEGGALVQKKCAVSFSGSQGVPCAQLN